MHEMGVFDKWFEGIGYHNSVFYDNEAPNCRWPWNGTKSAGWTWNGTECMTQVNASTVGAGYLTSELGNRTIEWIQRVSAEPVRRPWFVYFATFAPHGPGNPRPCTQPQNGTRTRAWAWSHRARTRTSTTAATTTPPAPSTRPARAASGATAPDPGGTERTSRS